MKLKNLNRADNFSFGLIASLVLICSGLLLATRLPDIKSWQINQSDRVINLAGQSSGQTRSNLLSQAAFINSGDPLATEYLAEHYRSIGDYNKAIATYQLSSASNNSVYLGNLALKASDYILTKSLFTKANNQERTAESLSGLALAEFATNHNSEGCSLAAQAKKLNLSSTVADKANVICEIQKGSSTLSPRHQAFLLADSSLYAKAIEKFQTINTKSSSDFILLSELYKAVGDNTSSAKAIGTGLSQDPTNKYLIAAQANILETDGKTSDAKALRDRLKDLEFNNFQ